MNDIAIIGAGPAGLCAAIYAKRAGNTVALFDTYMAGGQIMNTPDVENYLGFSNIEGIELAMKFSEHASSFGIYPEMRQTVGIEKIGEGHFKVNFADGDSEECRAVICCSGTRRRTLGIDGEERLSGRGVSYCATCDGNFYLGKTVAVVGGGNTAVEDAIYLSRLCAKVYLIHRRDAFRASKILTDRLHERDNLEVILNSNPVEIIGEEKVSALKISDRLSGDTREIALDGVFVAIGSVPEATYMPPEVEKAEDGSVITDGDCRTNVKGIFAAGDIRHKNLRQIITAAADGAIAATAAGEYIGELKIE